MSGYAKLYGSILDSSIWAEDSETRIVWITLLAMSDAKGVVEASVGGIAHQARVNRSKCADALKRFQQPDPESKNPAHQGRRIERIVGGFRLLNYQRYREGRDPERRREQNRRAQAARRSQLRAESAEVSQKSAGVSRRQQASAGVSRRQQASAGGDADRDAILGSKQPEFQPEFHTFFGSSPSAIVSHRQPKSAQAEAEAEAEAQTEEEKEKGARSGSRPFCPPPTRLSSRDREALARWASTCDPPFTAAQCYEAECRVLDWARANGRHKRDWLATVRNGMRAGWAVTPDGSRRSPEMEALRRRLEQEDQNEKR